TCASSAPSRSSAVSRSTSPSSQSDAAVRHTQPPIHNLKYAAGLSRRKRRNKTNRTINAVASMKAIASRPWFSSTSYRLPSQVQWGPGGAPPRATLCVSLKPRGIYLNYDANTLFSDWASPPHSRCAVPYNDAWEHILVDLENILVVDDEEAIREVVSTMLESKGYHCTAVSNGRAAQDQVKLITPDLVLSDMIMPEM